MTEFKLASALVDTSFVIDGLHGTRRQQDQYRKTIAAIQYPCASSYTKFEYVRKLGQQIALGFSRLARGESLKDTVVHLNTITSRGHRRGPSIAINVLMHTQALLREPDPTTERRKALAALRQQAEQLGPTFESKTGLDLRDGSRCHYQSMMPSFHGTGRNARIRWPEINCIPANLRCALPNHLRGVAHKAHCNSIDKKIKAIRPPERTGEQQNIVDAVALSRKSAGAVAIASHRTCLGIGDLVVFMDAIGLNHAITTNYKDWSAFDGVGGVRVIVFTGNPDEPAPFA